MADPLTTSPTAKDLPPREFQELWFVLERHAWRSLVLVPADGPGGAGAVAQALAEVGRWMGENPVTFVMRDTPDYAAGLQVLDRATPAAGTPVQRGTPSGRVIIAVQPVTEQPLGLALTQAADLVMLCVEMGQARLASAGRTIELVGRDRISGCFLQS